MLTRPGGNERKLTRPREKSHRNRTTRPIHRHPDSHSMVYSLEQNRFYSTKMTSLIAIKSHSGLFHQFSPYTITAHKLQRQMNRTLGQKSHPKCPKTTQIQKGEHDIQSVLKFECLQPASHIRATSHSPSASTKRSY